MSPDLFAVIYLVATVLFIFGLKGLASPRTALRGNYSAMLGMFIAVVTVMLDPSVKNYTWIIAGLGIGAVIGSVVALKIQMTAMPQLVAALHSFVGLSAVLVALGTFMMKGLPEQSGGLLGFISEAAHSGPDGVLLVELSLGSAIGAVTFTGSIIAFGKLQGMMGSNPVVFKGQHLLNLLLGILSVILVVFFVQDPTLILFLSITGIALLLGVLIVIPIGGADMPVIVSMLNSYSGWAASATGFTLKNNLLIATGALVGSSGAILSYIMCKAMNRSFISVILGGFGVEGGESSAATSGNKQVKSAAAEDAAYLIENSSKVIVVPGYGMAVAQAQHSLKELYELLAEKGVEMKFAIHPVAGRMPGHMNVLLAESDIPYDVVFEMDEINSEFSSCDVSLVIGANDVVNPAAKTDKSSPLYGMPVLDVYKSKQIFVCKRSMKAGYAGVDNDLFYYDNCSLIFGDAKATVDALIEAIRGGGH